MTNSKYGKWLSLKIPDNVTKVILVERTNNSISEIPNPTEFYFSLTSHDKKLLKDNNNRIYYFRRGNLQNISSWTCILYKKNNL